MTYGDVIEEWLLRKNHVSSVPAKHKAEPLESLRLQWSGRPVLGSSGFLQAKVSRETLWGKVFLTFVTDLCRANERQHEGADQVVGRASFGKGLGRQTSFGGLRNPFLGAFRLANFRQPGTKRERPVFFDLFMQSLGAGVVRDREEGGSCSVQLGRHLELVEFPKRTPARLR